MTITYTQVGDYLVPNLIPPGSPKIGRWGCCDTAIYEIIGKESIPECS